MLKRVVMERGGRKVIAMDSISYIEAADGGHIVVSASHAGASSEEPCRNVPPIRDLERDVQEIDDRPKRFPIFLGL